MTLYCVDYAAAQSCFKGFFFHGLMGPQGDHNGDIIFFKTARLNVGKEGLQYGSYRCRPGGVIDYNGNTAGF